MKHHNKQPPELSDSVRVCLALVLTFMAIPVFAFNIYLTDFNTNYGTQGTRLDSCGLCHVNFNGGGLRTSYGEDYRNNNYSALSIGLLDSDADGFTNDQEAALGNLTHPGFNCNNYFNALNAPANIVDYVDPSNPGCIGPGLSPVVNINGPYYGVSADLISLSSAGTFDPDGTIVSYFWDFGSFGSSTLANPQFAFFSTFSAKATISLTVTDNDGNRTTAKTTVTVLLAPNSPPVANIGPAVTGVVNTPVQFTASGSVDPEGARLRYSWDFGDQATGFGGVPLHSYSKCGTYNVVLTVFDNVGLEASATTTATISGTGINPPIANAGGGVTANYTGTTGSNVQFDGSSSTDPDCHIVNYSWDFGDGSIGSGITPFHSYILPGGYVVSLSVTDTDGLVSTATAAVNIVDSGPLNGQLLYDANCGSCHGTGGATTKPGATVARIDAGIATVPSMASLSILSAAERQAIADFLASVIPPPPPPPPTGPIDGAVSYDANCGSCHGMGVATTKPGATVARIDAGIATVPSMASLSVLSTAERQAIADFLASITPPPPPTGPVNGAVSYDTNCGSCHGFGVNSGKAGATVSRINAGISGVPSMTSLSVLAVTEIQAISDFLMTLTAPTTPQGLYATYCASCHGADGSGGSSGKNVIGDSVSKISSAIVKEADMQSLSFLADSEIQLISDFLNGVTTPPGGIDGLALYDINCAGCHGLSSNSAKAGATAARINSGIANEPSMSFFSNTLTAAEIQAIGDFLLSVAPTPPPGGGAGSVIYTSNCAGCHGPANNSAKAGATAARISNGISSVQSMNFLSTTLTTADIQSVAAFLATSPLPSTPEAKYISYCGSCHGIDAQGGSSGKDVTGDSFDKIRKAIDKESEMKSLSFLSKSDIKDIESYLKTLKDRKKKQKKNKD